MLGWAMKRALIAFAAIAANVAFGGADQQGKQSATLQTPSPQKMRVLTYNILYSGESDGKPKKWDWRRAWSHRRNDLADFVRRINSDIGGFQEVMPDQMEFLKGRMPEYSFSGEYRGEEDGKPLSGSPVFWRKGRFEAGEAGTFWLSPTPEARGSFGWGSPGPRICSWQILTDKTCGRRFCLANVHADHKSPKSKLKSAELVVKRLGKIAEGIPLVLIGDHNVQETEPPALVFAKAWRNALYESEAQPKGTWRSFNAWKMKFADVPVTEALKSPAEKRTWKKFGGRLDYIYVSMGVRVLAYETCDEKRPGLDLYYSDHFPVFADLLMSGEKNP